MACDLLSRSTFTPLEGAVLIADDHGVFRYGLTALLRDLLKPTAVVEAETFGEALKHLDKAARGNGPAITLALFDLGMPGLETVASLGTVRRRWPSVKVVVVTGSESRRDVLEALGAGVHGYIVKTTRIEEIVAHIAAVMDGAIYVPPLVAEPDATVSVAAAPPPRAEPTVPLEPLTERQRQVLAGVAAGLTNKEIAKRLGVAEGTVKMHVAALFRALNAQNRAHAASLGKALLG